MTSTAAAEVSLMGSLDASSYTGTDQNEGLNLVDNGTELYLANGAYTAPSDIIHWRLSDPYNLSSATHIETVSVKSTADNLRGFDINPEGTKFWIMEATSNDIHEFDLSTSYDISSKSKCCKYYVGSQTTSPRRLDIKSPVDKFWMAPGNPFYQYTSGGSSVSGGSYSSTSYDFGNDGFNGEMDWGEGGDKLYLYDFNSGATEIFTASTAFDIGTVSYDNSNYSTGSEVSGRGDINLVDSDNRLYAVGTSDIIKHFSTSDFAGGTGTSSNPYEIDTCKQLQKAGNNLSADYELISDIDCSGSGSWNSGKGFDPIGDSGSDFKGIFDGNGYIVKNLNISRSSDNRIGLFGINTQDSEIKGIGIEDAYVEGDVDVGILIGDNNGKITQSYTNGTVDGSNYVGGLAGDNSGAGIISETYSHAKVYGSDRKGGLIGNSVETVKRSYSTGNVTDSQYDGGLIGVDTGSTSSSYWDVETSGQPDQNDGYDDSGKGLTTAETTGSACGMTGLKEANWTFNTGERPELDLFAGSGINRDCNKPVADILGPENTNLNPSGGVELEVNATESTGEQMNITFYDASDDSEIDRIENVGNGTYTTTWSGLSTDQTHNYYAEVTDGTNTVQTTTATFTTIDVTLNWNDQSNNENGFKIYSNASGTLKQISTASTDSTSKTVYNPGLQFGKNTTYKITAYNQYGESGKIKGYITP